MKGERELAIVNGCYREGVPAITVIVDGGWIKMSQNTHTIPCLA